MAVGEKRTRITISPTKELLAKIDAMCNRMGMTRSSTCSWLISQGLESYDLISNLSEEKLKIVVDALSEE